MKTIFMSKCDDLLLVSAFFDMEMSALTNCGKICFLALFSVNFEAKLLSRQQSKCSGNVTMTKASIHKNPCLAYNKYKKVRNTEDRQTRDEMKFHSATTKTDMMMIVVVDL